MLKICIKWPIKLISVQLPFDWTAIQIISHRTATFFFFKLFPISKFTILQLSMPESLQFCSYFLTLGIN
jgi:hypothetical protein